MDAGDLIVPVEHEIRRRLASDLGLRRVGGEHEQPLAVLAVPVDQERPARAFGLDASLQVGDELRIGRSLGGHAAII